MATMGGATSEPLIAARGLSGGYGGEPALVEVDFEARPGEIVGVLGPNGGGKTSLFRAILGELPVASGALELAGRPAYVPQGERSRLDFPVTAYDVALMGAYGRSAWWRRIAKRDRRLTEEALEQVGLAGKGKTPYGELSGGQRQRVLVARALVQDAPVLLLDEPFSGVDEPNAERLGALFGDLRAAGKTLLVATHDIRQAERWEKVLCLRIRQVAFGRPSEVLDRETLRKTYGPELIVLDDDTDAVVIDHHSH